MEALVATGVLSQLWPPTSLGWFGSWQKVAAPQGGWGEHSREPGDRIWAKPSLSLGVPSVEFSSSPVFPEFSVHPKFASTVPKGTTQESTPYPTASKGWAGDSPASHQHCKTALHLLLWASKGYYVLTSCCVIHQPSPFLAEITGGNKQTPQICYFPFPMPRVRKRPHVNQSWVWMGSGLQQVCSPTSYLRLTAETLAPLGDGRGHEPCPHPSASTVQRAWLLVPSAWTHWGHLIHPNAQDPATQATMGTGCQQLSISALPRAVLCWASYLPLWDSVFSSVIIITTMINSFLSGKYSSKTTKSKCSRVKQPRLWPDSVIYWPCDVSKCLNLSESQSPHLSNGDDNLIGLLWVLNEII